MANHTIDTDVALHIYHSAGNSGVGYNSRYLDEEHPGTDKKIVGWPWDRKTWPIPKEAESPAYIPTMWDASKKLLSETFFQSGYGSGKDIQLLEIKDKSYNNTNVWSPRIHNGKYYIHDEPNFVFSDAHETQYFSRNLTTYSGLLAVTLNRRPKNCSHIAVRRWERDDANGNLTLDVNARHRYAFSGTTISGVEQSTSDALRVLNAANVDFSVDEFIVDNSDANHPVVITNKDVRTIGRSISTTTSQSTNLIQYSEDFTTGWSTVNATVNTNVIANPINGSVNADGFEETGVAVLSHVVYPAKINVVAGVRYTVSIYAKANNNNWLYLWWTLAPAPQVWFNLTTGAKGTENNVDDAGIISVGNGWYRCWMSWTAPTTTSEFIYILSTSGDGTPAGSGVSGNALYIWGAQFEVANSPSDYIGTTAGERITPVLAQADLDVLEILGASDGTADQEFKTKYFPIDDTEPIGVCVFSNYQDYTKYNVSSGILSLPSGNNPECHVDTDFGVVTFGDYNPTDGSGNGQIPASGLFIGMHYISNLECKYEPHYTDDAFETPSVNIDPLTAGISDGFLQISTSEDRVGSVSLSSSMTQTGYNLYSIQSGNNYGAIIATVRDTDGELLGGVKVTFSFTGASIGAFSNGSTTITAITNENGQATVYYLSPQTVDDMGAATTSVSHSGSDTVIRVESVPDPTTVTGEFFLWRIDAIDPVLGMSEADATSEYSSYFTDAEILEDQADEDVEVDYRTRNQMLQYATYADGNLTTGRKRIVVERRSTNIHPHSGVFDSLVYAPLYPRSITNLGTTAAPDLEITYGNVLLPLIDGNDSLKSYFVAGGGRVSFQASAAGGSGRTIYSNQINTDISSTDKNSGSYYCNLISDVPESFLSKTKNINSIDEVSEVTLSGHFANLENEWIEDRRFNITYADTIYTSFGGEFVNDPIDISAWTQSQLSVTLKSSGDGPTNQDVYAFNEVNNSSQFAYDATTWSTSDTVEVVFYAKAGHRDHLYVIVSNRVVQFNLTDIYWEKASNILSADIEDVGDGWRKCTVRVVTTSSQRIYIYISDGIDPDPQINTARIVGEAFYVSDVSAKEATVTETASRIVPESFVTWFRRTRSGDSELLGLTDVSVTNSPGEIPIGWRLKDSNTTFASALDALTFVDANNVLASGYFDLT